MQGKIVKGIAGFYYVHVVESGVYECKAKGIFRKDKKKPLVGDDVEIEVLSEVEKTGSIINIFERKNELIRPAVILTRRWSYLQQQSQARILTCLTDFLL